MNHISLYKNLGGEFMSTKKATYTSLILITLLAIGYLVEANKLSAANNSSTIGPSYFPTLLSILLIISCVVSWIQTMNKDDKKFPLDNLKVIFTTISVTAFYFISWYFIGYFYLNTFIFLMVLLIIYSPKKEIKKNLFINLITSGGILIFIYVLFDLILKIKF